MKRIRNTSSLLAKYTLMYEKKPRSRVFAPLAETYRKLGMHADAMKVLKEGIKNHPTYTLAYIVLANCYYDTQNFEMAYNTVRPFVSKNLENISLQKLFAKTCMNLGYLEEALEAYKYLLLLNSRDTEVAKQIKILEDDLLVNQEVIEQTKTTNNESSFDEEDWVQVNFFKEEEPEKEMLDEWSMGEKSPLEKFKNEIKKDQIEVKEHQLDDEYYHEDFDNQAHEVIAPKKREQEVTEKKEDSPIITHTLVDLYCQQGHLEQAAAVLENILELHPNDELTQIRLDEIVTIMATSSIAQDSKNIDEINNQKIEKINKFFSLYVERLQDISSAKLSFV
jgi:predicted Zn-dependent protease